MKFGYAIVYVPSVAASLAFYGKAFGLPTKFLHEAGDYGELDTGSTVLAFASHALGEANFQGKYLKLTPQADPAGIELAFVADDVEAAYATALAAGAVAVKPPAQKPWGQTVAYVRALDGELIELCSPMQG